MANSYNSLFLTVLLSLFMSMDDLGAQCTQAPLECLRPYFEAEDFNLKYNPDSVMVDTCEKGSEQYYSSRAFKIGFKDAVLPNSFGVKGSIVAFEWSEIDTAKAQVRSAFASLSELGQFKIIKRYPDDTTSSRSRAYFLSFSSPVRKACVDAALSKLLGVSYVFLMPNEFPSGVSPYLADRTTIVISYANRSMRLPVTGPISTCYLVRLDGGYKQFQVDRAADEYIVHLGHDVPKVFLLSAGINTFKISLSNQP